MIPTRTFTNAALLGLPTWKYRWDPPRSSPVPNHLARLLIRFHHKIYAPLCVQLVGNSFVSPTHSLSLSQASSSAPIPQNSFSRSAWSAGRWGLWYSYCCCCCRWCVVCCCLWNDPGACLLLAAWFREINRPSTTHTHTHTHTHTYIAGGVWVGNKQLIHAVMWIERWRSEITDITGSQTFHSEVCLLCANFVIEGVLEPSRPTNRPIYFTRWYSFGFSKNWLVD